MNRNRAVDFWVGLFALAGIAALLFIALRAANASSFSTEPGITVKGRFTNIGGLKIRAPVRSAGVVVGRVTQITFDSQTFEAVVSFTVNVKYPFPKDTSAQILTSGLLGEQYIGLTAGGDTANLKDGDTLQITQSAVILENLIGQFLYSKAAEGGTDKPGSGAAAPGAAAPGPGGAPKSPTENRK
jgi:phospholipid/cholesterol/gamma-HCH transport system substrate-binding protein